MLRRATHDPAVRLAFLEVLSLLQPPRALVHPRVLLPTLGVALRRHASARAAGGVPASPPPLKSGT